MTNPLKIVALIPARLESTRMHQKLLRVLEGKTIIMHTYQAVSQSGLFDEVIVVCDHPLLYDEVIRQGGKAMMSSPHHQSGSDRIAEAAAQIQADIIVNIQGDEPFISPEAMQALLALFKNEQVQIASLKQKISDQESLHNPSVVKVVCDLQGRALYFSRSPIPYVRELMPDTTHYKHIGVYGFRKETLMAFTTLPPTMLEQTEKLENLRMLEQGLYIHLAEIQHIGISIDTEEDFQKAQDYLKKIKQ